jgi:hypothetical protein
MRLLEFLKNASFAGRFAAVCCLRRQKLDDFADFLPWNRFTLNRGLAAGQAVEQSQRRFLVGRTMPPAG